MTSSHPTPAPCQWSSWLAAALDRRPAPRLALLFFGAVLARDGPTKREALISLLDATAIQFEASLLWKNRANFFSPAPGRYFEMYALGKDVGQTEMDVPVERFSRIDGELDEISGREYADSHLMTV